VTSKEAPLAAPAQGSKRSYGSHMLRGDAPISTEDLPMSVRPAYERLRETFSVGHRFLAVGVTAIIVALLANLLTDAALPSKLAHGVASFLGLGTVIAATLSMVCIFAGGIYILALTVLRCPPELREAIEAIEAGKHPSGVAISA